MNNEEMHIEEAAAVAKSRGYTLHASLYLLGKEWTLFLVVDGKWTGTLQGDFVDVMRDDEAGKDEVVLNLLDKDEEGGNGR